MPRPVLVTVLAVAVLMNGCARQETNLLPVADSDRLAQTIIQRGEGQEVPGEPVAAVPEPCTSPVLGSCIETGVKIGATCLLVSVVVGFLCLYGLARGGGGGGNFGGMFSGMGNAIGSIWKGD